MQHTFLSYHTQILVGNYRIGHLTTDKRNKQKPAASMFTVEGYPKMLVCVCKMT
jgi:hypothetical protein